MYGWFIFSVLFVMIITALVVWPLANHTTLPRRKKWLLSVIIFLVLTPGGLLLYGWVGMPAMALL